MLITFEQLILLQLFLRSILFNAHLRSLHNHLLHLLVSQLYLLLHYYSNFPGICQSVLHFSLLFRKGRVFFEHDLIIFFFFFLDLLYPFLSDVLINLSFYLLVLQVYLFLQSLSALLLSLFLFFFLSAVFLLLDYHKKGTFSRYLLSHWSSFWLKLRSSYSIFFFLVFYLYFYLGCSFRSYYRIRSTANFLTQVWIEIRVR